MNYPRSLKFVIFCGILLVVLGAAYLAGQRIFKFREQVIVPAAVQGGKNQSQNDVAATNSTSSLLANPVPDAKARITKKPFGIYVSPSHSPVSPERFAGFHTGVDFETTSGEKDANVAVSAVCSGTGWKESIPK